MKKKKYLYLIAIWLVLLIIGSFGCGQQRSVGREASEKLQIVCTIFPAYDWVKEILGERMEEVELTLLMKNGADLHSYQPTVWDMKKIAEADLFVYVGGESDFWVDAVLENGKNPKQKTLNLMEILGDAVREEAHVEGMQEERAHHEEAHVHEEDEHVWLSLRNAALICQKVAEVLCEIDGEHQEIYQQNVLRYQEKLQTLDLAYQKMVEQTFEPVLLFGDRFPFLYLMEDYGIDYYAAFAGCSAETEASFYTITYLAEKAGALSLPAVLKIDGSDGKIAQTIAGNIRTRDQKVLLLDSMQSVSAQEIEKGVCYLSLMEQNLKVLEEALIRGE